MVRQSSGHGVAKMVLVLYTLVAIPVYFVLGHMHSQLPSAVGNPDVVIAGTALIGAVCVLGFGWMVLWMWIVFDIEL